jgi:hypothetical protein
MAESGRNKETDAPIELGEGEVYSPSPQQPRNPNYTWVPVRGLDSTKPQGFISGYRGIPKTRSSGADPQRVESWRTAVSRPMPSKDDLEIQAQGAREVQRRPILPKDKKG